MLSRAGGDVAAAVNRHFAAHDPRGRLDGRGVSSVHRARARARNRPSAVAARVGPPVSAQRSLSVSSGPSPRRATPRRVAEDDDVTREAVVRPTDVAPPRRPLGPDARAPHHSRGFHRRVPRPDRPLAPPGERRVRRSRALRPRRAPPGPPGIHVQAPRQSRRARDGVSPRPSPRPERPPPGRLPHTRARRERARRRRTRRGPRRRRRRRRRGHGRVSSTRPGPRQTRRRPRRRRRAIGKGTGDSAPPKTTHRRGDALRAIAAESERERGTTRESRRGFIASPTPRDEVPRPRKKHARGREPNERVKRARRRRGGVSARD